MITPAEAARFLARTAPFDSLPHDELARLADDAKVLELESGQLLVDSTASETEVVWVVYQGQVLLWAYDADVTAEPTEIVNVGGLVGFASLLIGGSVQFTARTNGPSTLLQLPDHLVRPVFSRPEGASYLAGQVSAGFAPAKVPFEGVLGSRPVGELLHADPVLVSPETSVRDAVRHMTEMRSSYVLIGLGDGEYGIFTDRDLRTKVVAVDISVDAPIHTVMTAPARVVTDDRVVTTVLIEMLEFGMRHMPVVNNRGQILGVLDDVDLLAASTRRSFFIRRAIASSITPDALVRSSAGIKRLVVDLHRGNTDPSTTSGILSVVIDSMVRRALELAIAETGDLSWSGIAWITLGSIARREAMPSSDVDSALSWADDREPDAKRYRRLATRVHQILDECDLPADRNGALASSPRFARSRSAWLQASRQWMAEPLENQGLIMSSLLIDGRVTWGDPTLHTVPVGFRRMRLDHPEALRLHLLDALSSKVWHRSFWDRLARRGDAFDLKTQLLTPVVNLARWCGLSVGIASASTPARLSSVAGNELLTDADLRILTDVFHQLQRIRMQHQVEQLTADQPPSDSIRLAELSVLDRGLLAESVREVAAVQRLLASRRSGETFG